MTASVYRTGAPGAAEREPTFLDLCLPCMKRRMAQRGPWRAMLGGGRFGFVPPDYRGLDDVTSVCACGHSAFFRVFPGHPLQEAFADRTARVGELLATLYHGARWLPPGGRRVYALGPRGRR
jgi:hypothetical protein